MTALPRGLLVLSIAFVLILLGGLVVFAPLFTKERIVQPISYNHKVHVETAGLGCQDCHVYADEHAQASIPTLEMCRTCHSEAPLTESEEETKLSRYISEEKEVPWVQIHSVPDHVYFSHRRHVAGGGLECVVCHGKVEEQTQPLPRPEVAITMENCMACHKLRNVTNDCLTCHR